MTNITINLVKILRYRTGLGIIECKNALIKSKGDIELAIDYLRKTGIKNFLKITKKDSKEGIIISGISRNNKYGIIIELNCETDFVAKNKYFKNFCYEIINTSLSKKIDNIKSIRDILKYKNKDIINKLGENIKINRFNFLKGNYICSYIHNEKIGVLLCANKYHNILKKIAMHIAASFPKYIDIKDIPNKVLKHEYNIQLEIAIKSGKSKEISKKIVTGRMKKFSENISLVNQHFIFNPKIIVKEILKENDIFIKKFIYMKVNQNN
ncbi:translation elongation factor Ts [Sodalis-like secondary symbiont of Drepanosiphum platanoidis]|uniref:translation elongation factor Ts n=1 Tax=Sodalis-like secondary symbiont of Drepanosiphum platanoidis TaxID=2994493 RepID=UPI003464B0B9